MIPIRLKTTLIIAVVMFFVIVIILLRNRRLEMKYTLLWLLTGVVLSIMIAFPESLRILLDFIGIVDNMNGLFILVIAFLIIILMSLTSIVSKHSNRVNRLIEENALLEKRVRDLEELLHKTGMKENGLL